MTVPESVVLLAPDGTPAGTADKAAVHTTETPLHLAFSCHVLDTDGRVLLTRRALAKRTWPGVWTNSFCGHPAPGEAMEDAVLRRGRHELGLELEALQLVMPDFRYRAVDASGIVENEVCPVYVARAASPLRLNPEEVMDHTWVTPEALRRAVDDAPFALSPWLVQHAPGLSILQDVASA